MWERLGTFEDYSRVVCTYTTIYFPGTVEASIKILNYDFWVTSSCLLCDSFQQNFPVQVQVKENNKTLLEC